MWILLRAIALALLVVVGLLLAGRDAWFTEALVGLTGAGAIGAVAPRSPAVTAAGMALGSVSALARPLNLVVGQFVTLLHELGHTVVAAAVGARPRGIVLRHDASGHATARWVGRGRLLRRLALAAVAFAGVPAAATVSAAGARLLVTVGPRPVLWSIAAAGALVAVLARSAWSLLIAILLGVLAMSALRDTAAPWAAGVVVGVLTATAIKTSYDNMRRVRLPILDGDDAQVAGSQLSLPSRLVLLVQVAVAAALSAWTVWLLVPGLASGN